MHVVTQPNKCSKCGSMHNETFYLPGVSGVRCLDCGHEKKAVLPQTESSAEWSQKMSDERLF